MSYGVTDRGKGEKGARVNVIQMLRSRSPGTKEGGGVLPALLRSNESRLTQETDKDRSGPKGGRV